MRIIVKHTAAEVDLSAAQEVVRQLLVRPDSVLGLSTGNTVMGLHRELVRLHRECGISFARAVTFNVDEYVGVAKDHPGSCRYRIFEQLLDLVDIRSENCHIPDGESRDLDEEARSYERRIRQAGGIDLQILGIGTNGHIGFNEPGTPFESRIRVAVIAQQSLAIKSEFYRAKGIAPREAITLGIRNIMESRKIVLVAKGVSKAEIMQSALLGPVTPDVPGSVLQIHPDTVVFLDREAAGAAISSPAELPHHAG
jgi:glucosamine-6-phosphate deaminase